MIEAIKKAWVGVLALVAALSLTAAFAVPQALAVEGDASGDTSVVASVGEDKYSSVQEAVNTAKAGETVVLEASVTENVTIAEDDNITLDLNGFTLSGGTGVEHSGMAAILNNGTLTIVDTKGNGVIQRADEGTANSSYYVIDNQGTMTIQGGFITNNSGDPANGDVGSSLIRNGGYDKATLTIEGGTLQQDNFIAVKNDDYGILNITGGHIISANKSAVQNWAKANITGGTIDGLILTSVWSDDLPASETTISGKATINGSFMSDKYYEDLLVAPVTEITGGNIHITSWDVDAGTVEVSGGTFTGEVPYEYLADGFIFNESGQVVPEPTYHTVQFVFVKGDLSETIPVEVEHGEKVDAPEVPGEFSGLTLKGWYTSKDATPGTEFELTTPITTDLTLYSGWADETEQGTEEGDKPAAEEEAGDTLAETGDSMPIAGMAAASVIALSVLAGGAYALRRREF